MLVVSCAPGAKSASYDCLVTRVHREPEKAIYVSQHHTRCEQWSTLREMLPSRGRAEPQKQPNWGTGRGVAPSLVGTRVSRYPVYDSEMTR